MKLNKGKFNDIMFQKLYNVFMICTFNFMKIYLIKSRDARRDVKRN